jgi:2-amino-4-hydroxy-6-hydroxymethyldihydropteridine diphosphokinase
MNGSGGVFRAYVGLGANLGDREHAIRQAAELLGARRLSTIRETEPWGLADQPRFLNAVAEVDAEQPPRAFLERLLEVERSLGRRRSGPRWGPRTIDLDLLVYGDEIVDEPGLTVPHPRLPERLFVLEPLAELDPSLKIPGMGTVSSLLAKLQSTS